MRRKLWLIVVCAMLVGHLVSIGFVLLGDGYLLGIPVLGLAFLLAIVGSSLHRELEAKK